MEKLIELLQQIQELANVAIDALQGASEGAAAAAPEGAPEGGGGGGESAPAPAEGAPEEE